MTKKIFFLAGFTLLAVGRALAASIWLDSTVPGLADAGPDLAVELGVTFRSDVTGTITGVRFYKAAANTGTHVGNLWSSTGTLLATATFSSESASGWQQVLFSTPVPIAANTTYVASYHTDVGHYSFDSNYFGSSGVDNPPLHALANTVSGNGVFAYGSSSSFPSETYNATNYWIDVVFQAGTPITLTLAGSKTYDGTTSSTGATVAVTSGTLRTGDTFTYVVGNASSADAGAYTLAVTATIKDSTNSDVTGTYSITSAGSYSIDKAALTVAADDAARIYGSTDPVFTSAYSGFVNGETVAVVGGVPSLTTPATSGSAAGTYPISAAEGSLVAANYQFTFVSGTLTVNKATLIVTGNSVTKVSGAPNPTFIAIFSGFANGDTAEVLSGAALLTTTATATSPVGSYAITAAVGSLATPNYQFAFVDGVLVVVPTPSLVSIWSIAAIPGLVDSGPDSPVELGVKFRSDVAGTITGIRFYKAAANTGMHVANLWNSTGTQLATAAFSSESASGWQQVLFSTPVSIAANTTYVASYHTDVGHYSFGSNYFDSSGVDNGPLHALANTISGNGVFGYGSNSVFPSESYNAGNYWVDVAFQPSVSGAAVLPYVADFEPAEGYTIGFLSGQLGWTVGSGASVISNQDFAHGTQSVQLAPSTPPSVIGQTFASSVGQTVEFFDFSAKPVAGTPPGTASTFTIEESEFAFQLSGSQGVLSTFSGNGSGGGSWASTTFTTPLDANHQAQNWVRLTARLDFTRQLWDLYANSQMVAADIPFISNSTYLSSFQLQGDVTAISGLDDIFAGPINPLFTDINNNGLDDGWEIAHGLSLANNNRNSSPSGNGITVIQAYVDGTDPNDFFNSATPTLTIIGGNNQIAPASQFNPLEFDVGVWNAGGTVPLVNAPVIFSVQSGSGKLALTNTGGPTLADILTVMTDVNGIARLFYKQPTGYGTHSVISAAAGNAAVSFDTATLATLDTDGNGLTDSWEVQYFGHIGVDPNVDPDGDDLTNIQEFTLGTNPTLADTDGDGVRDGVEVMLGMNPLVVDSATLPTKIAGLRLYLSADIGVQTDSAGNVSRWSDQSGMVNDAIQTDAGSRPVLIPAAMNGFPIVRFQNKQLLLSNVMAGATTGEVFVVLRAANAVAPGAPYFNGYSLWKFSAEDAPGGSGGFFPDTGGNISEDFGRTSPVILSNPGYPVDQTILYNVVSAPAEWTARLNAKVAYTTSTNTVGFRSAPVLGASQGFYSSGFQGDIAEIIIYDHELSSVDRESVGAYLTTKYALGITVPAAATSLSATVISSTQVSLTWSVENSGLNTITSIERQTGGGAFVLLAETENGLGYLDSGLTAGVAYNYRVRLRSYAGTSAYSNTASVMPVAGVIDMPMTGMRLWLKADQGTQGAGLMFDWLDQSGLGNDASQVTANLRPLLVPNAINGRPAVRFANSQLNLPDVMAGATAGEVFVVLRAANAVAPGAPYFNGYSLWRFSAENAPAGSGGFFPDTGGKIFEDFGRTSPVNFLNPSSPIDQPALYNVVSAPAEWTARLNAVVAYTTSSNTVGFRSAPLLGVSQGFYSSGFQGDIAEVMIYDHPLTLPEREAICFYLDRKYAMNLPVTSTGSLTDRNGDGLSDAEDVARGFDPYSMDVDGDGIPNSVEITNGTDPLNADTDHDGVPDGLDYYPLDATRWQAPVLDPNDHTPPVVTLTSPAQATLN